MHLLQSSPNLIFVGSKPVFLQYAFTQERSLRTVLASLRLEKANEINDLVEERFGKVAQFCEQNLSRA